MTDGNPFAFTAADWRSATCLRAKVHGTVAQYRPQLACPERSLATVEALHGFLTEALAAESVPDAAAVARGLLLQALDPGALPLPQDLEDLSSAQRRSRR
jgi:hypothetical protein